MLSTKNRPSGVEHDKENEPPMATIYGVQYGIMSMDDVLRLSSGEVNSTIITKSGIVQRFGINDSHFGTILNNMLCGTCANSMDSCPGHTGHINLAEPVINIEFLSYVHKILTCVCFYCSRLLLPEDHPKYAAIMRIKNTKQRFSEIYDVCSKYRKCCSWADHTASRKTNKKRKREQEEEEEVASTDQDADMKTLLKQRYCQGVQPTYTKDDVVVRATFAVTRKDVKRGVKFPSMSSRDIFDILHFMIPDDIRKLSLDPEHSLPSSMMWRALLVPPVAMRPSRSKPNNTRIGNEDDLTIRLRAIVKSNGLLQSIPGVVNFAQYHFEGAMYQSMEEVKQVILTRGNLTKDVSKDVSKDVPYVVPSKRAATHESRYIELQKNVAGYQDSKYQLKNAEGSDYGRERKCLRSRFSGQTAKRGRVRDTILGKRMDYSARTVITPDNYIRVDELGVPISMCKTLTFPETVTRLNIHKLTEMVRRGPTSIPGPIMCKKQGASLSLCDLVTDTRSN